MPKVSSQRNFVFVFWAAAIASAVFTGRCFAGIPHDQEEAQLKRAVPTEEDLAKLTNDKVKFIDRLLTVVEQEIVPKTDAGVHNGNKLFGGAVLKKSDLSTLVAATNTETGNPLMHGEVTTIFEFYKVPRDQRPPASECIFLTTHEPCPLCLSSITWGGFDNFFYLFTYEDSRDAFSIPHDINMHREIFMIPDAEYNHKNRYWKAWGVKKLIESCDETDRKKFEDRLANLKTKYDEMSAIYQKNKNSGAEIPLK